MMWQISSIKTVSNRVPKAFTISVAVCSDLIFNTAFFFSNNSKMISKTKV